MVICLERGVDLHMAQLMPLPVTISCFSKIQIGFTFLVLAHPGSPGKGPLNGCVCVCHGTHLQFLVLSWNIMIDNRQDLFYIQPLFVSNLLYYKLYSFDTDLESSYHSIITPSFMIS